MQLRYEQKGLPRFGLTTATRKLRQSAVVAVPMKNRPSPYQATLGELQPWLLSTVAGSSFAKDSENNAELTGEMAKAV